MARPAVFMGMGDADLVEMGDWLGMGASVQDSDPALSTPNASYQRGVHFCLGQVGIGFTAIAGASIIKTWRDRHGSLWTWNDDAMEPECDAMRLLGQVDDLLELPDGEFTAFARGMLDAAGACGWDGRA
jgi:hypothetical protein